MVSVHKNINALLAATADLFVGLAKEAIKDRGKFTVALSGGSSPKKLHEMLASDDYKHEVEWKNVYFFFGDERYVPLSDKQSNYRMAKDTLFDPLHINDKNIFPVDTTLPSDSAARDYEQTILKRLGASPQFDLIILGLGDDAHTASLFPHTLVLHEKDAWVKSHFVKKVNMDRITFTAKLINNADTVAFLVYGAAKAEAVHHVLRDDHEPEEYPAQLINPTNGKVHWFLDEEAAKQILAV